MLQSLLLHLAAASALRLSPDRDSGRCVASAGSAAGAGWAMCRAAAPRDCISSPTVPGSALLNLLRNGSFAPVTLDNLYYATNLARIPDISAPGGVERYTFTLSANLSALWGDCAGWAPPAALRLHLRGVSYRAGVTVAGQPASTVEGGPAVGMFRRVSYLLPASGADVAITVHPPDFPGAPTCPAGHQGACGQGGDHLIARNAAAAQFQAGWDWIQATPDRSTGLWDRVELEAVGPVVAEHPALIAASASPAAAAGRHDVEARLVLTLRSLSASPANGSVNVTVRTAGGGAVSGGEWSTRFAVKPGATLDLSAPLRLCNVSLWWPHQLGEAVLHTVCAEVAVDGGGGLSHRTCWRAGLRTLRIEVDPDTQGRNVWVNGVRMFLAGGNWITTDQLLRYTDDRQRYRDEIRYHREAGLSLIRVWGGGITEREGFWAECDQQGLLVLQEFWMSGDNNGRWAGQRDWPDDHGAYLANAQDVIRTLRRHASLLLYTGGNELDAPSSPPGDILAGLRAALEQHDPGRLLVPSSMTNFTHWDPEVGLAPKDGPYGWLDERQYSERNPGLLFWNDSRRVRAGRLLIGFQPEITPYSMAPRWGTMRRVLSPAGLAVVPDSKGGLGPSGTGRAEWEFHKYLNYWDGEVDHVWNYGAPANLEEWTLRAQMTQLMQTRFLFEGFQRRMWDWYTAVAIWTSQMPWPSFRGGIYDWHLAPKGGYWGARAALRGAVHAQADPTTLELSVVTRSQGPAPAGMSLAVEFHTLANSTRLGADLRKVPAGGAFFSAMSLGAAQWPQTAPGEVLLLRLILRDADSAPIGVPNDYWFSEPGQKQNLTALGALRQRQGALLGLISRGERAGVLTVGVANRGPDAAIAVLLEPRRGNCSSAADADPAEPAWLSDGMFSLLPGEGREVTAELPPGAGCVLAAAWNSPPACLQL